MKNKSVEDIILDIENNIMKLKKATGFGKR